MMTLSSISKDGRYGFGNNFSGLWIVFLDDFFFFLDDREKLRTVIIGEVHDDFILAFERWKIQIWE